MTQTNATGDPDVYFPKLEANYNLVFGAGYIKPFAGFQYYQVKSGDPAQNVQDDIDIYSYVLGASSDVEHRRLRPRRPGELRHERRPLQLELGLQCRLDLCHHLNTALPVFKTNGKSVADAETLQAMIVPSLKFTDTLRFEGGLGYRMDKPTALPGYSQKDGSWVGYVQALVTLAPGVYLLPGNRLHRLYG